LILLDTDAIIELLEKRSKIGEEVYSSLISSGEPIGTTAINLHELLYGLKKYAKTLKELLQMHVIDYTKEDAELSSQIELGMERAGMAVRRADTMIAAIAINHSMKLFTLDTKHFEPLSKRTALRLFSH